MQSKHSLKSHAYALAAASTILLAAPAQAGLQARDLNHDSVTDAFYDTDFNITWLRDAHVIFQTSWADAMAWVNGYSFGGYDDWRLPTLTSPDPGCTFGGNPSGIFGYNCTASEMGHMWYNVLGNTEGQTLVNAGDFLNLQAVTYWASTDFGSNAGYAGIFSINGGLQSTGDKNFDYYYAWAVRDGDIRQTTPVPEPGSALLAIGGILGLAWVRKRKVQA